jgi:hypothetical protein
MDVISRVEPLCDNPLVPFRDDDGWHAYKAVEEKKMEFQLPHDKP